MSNPKTVFLGNGINHLSDHAISWNKLLSDVMLSEKFEMNFLPNLLTYERIRLGWEAIYGNTDNLKVAIADKLQKQSGNEFYKKILTSNFTNYLTTNYDYALKKSYLELNGENSIINNSTEDIYSIRRNQSLLDKEKKQVAKVWNIHGELDSPKSIMLGMHHYCGSLGKIDEYLKGRYNFKYKVDHLPIKPIEAKIETQKFDGYSWIELFFNTDVHIAGFGMDFSELDIWLILTKRARLKASLNLKNKIYYYTRPLRQVIREPALESRKREMMKSLFVDIIEVEVIDDDYKKQWDEFISKMNSIH